MTGLFKDNEGDAQFLKEIRTLFNQRLYILFWVGFILFPFFSFLDYYAVRELFKEFLYYRLICSFLFIILLAFSYTGYGKNHPFGIALAGYLICGSFLSLMVVAMGGYTSFYYIGLICVLVAFSSILPLTIHQSLFSGVLLYLLYIIPIMMFNDSNKSSIVVFFNNNFFFMFFLVISIVKSHEDYKSRLREYGFRKKLDYHASNLEKKVVKRTIKLEESELRYRELYNNIIDRVVLVDPGMVILVANPNFYRMMGIEERKKKRLYLTDYIHKDDVTFFMESIVVDLRNNVSITDCEFRMVSIRSEIIDIECNVKSVMTGDRLTGYQFVMRNITFRKKLERDLMRSLKRLRNTKYISIMGLAKLTEYRDKETGRHLERIQEYSRLITQELASYPTYENYITDEYINDIYLSSILHDIGKVGVPDAVLLKPSRLTPEEFEVIKLHCKFGGDALAELESQIEGESFFTIGKEIAYYHHEKWDGTGYLKKLKGQNIPLSARIVAISDVYDALTTKRIYKEAFSHKKAMDIIQEERGAQFDPDIVDAFFINSEKFREIKNCLKN